MRAPARCTPFARALAYPIGDLTGRISGSRLIGNPEIQSHYRSASVMIQAFVITLREGLEAFLIVAITLAYLRKAGRRRLTTAVHWGIAAALALSALGGYVLYHAANQEWFDGPLAIVAAASVTWMIVHMWRAGRQMKGNIEGHLRTSSGRVGTGAFVGVFLFTVLMVTREGMETALLLVQLRETLHLAGGAALGVAGAAGLAWLWSRF